MVSNIEASQVEPLIDNPGITNADFSFYNLFKEQIDSKTISSLMEGNPMSVDMTATQYLDMQKKQMMKIGGKIDGIVQWEKEMLKLRTYNLLANGYEKDKDGKYRDVAVEDKMSDGVRGLNIMRFTDTIDVTPEQIFDEENKYLEDNGQLAEITYLNPELMREILEDDDYFLMFEVVPVDKNNDKLTQLMFVNMINQAAQLFGYDSLQVERLKKQYAGLMGRPYDDIFIPEEELQMKRQQMMQAEQAPGGEQPKEIQAPAMSDVMTM